MGLTKITIIPEHFYEPGREREILGDICTLESRENVRVVPVPDFGAVMLYVPQGDALPELYYLLQKVTICPDYNKILCNYSDSTLSLVVAQGRNLLLANTFQAIDFTTAEYFIFNALKTLQINPEMSTIRWNSHITQEEQLSLYRYFESVDYI